MVRKILDGISVASFLISSTILLGGGYIYFRRAEFVNQIMSNLQDQMIDVIQYQIKQQVKLPSATGPALPFK
tara:strand:- start:316 stop:531 length:216 start_codon:yes stop_codon:yes gene_type:complete